MYFVIDLEATCWENRNVRDRNEIIEIGIAACSFEGEILRTYQSFVKPIFNPKLSIFCKKLTHIEQDWIDSANPLREVISDLIGQIELDLSIKAETIPWCSFGEWDEICLKRDCDRHELLSPFGKYINLKTLYAGYSGCQHCGLLEALRREGFDFEGDPHRALIDAINAFPLAKFLITPEVINQKD